MEWDIYVLVKEKIDRVLGIGIDGVEMKENLEEIFFEIVILELFFSFNSRLKFYLAT